MRRAWTIVVVGLLCFALLVLTTRFGLSTDPPVPTWTRTFGGVEDDEPFSVVQTKDGGYALAGYTNSYGAGGRDFWLIRVDSAGNAVWNQTYGGSNDDSAASVIQASDGGYVLAGSTMSYGAGQRDVWLVKASSGGNVLWSKAFGGTGLEQAFSVIQTSDGGYALAGYITSYGSGSADFWLVKTDASGTALWNETYGGLFDDRAYSVVQTADGGYALAGYTFSSGVNGSFWLVKTDGDGIEQWNKWYGGNDYEYCLSMVQTSDEGYSLAGYREEASGAGSSDFWLVKVDSSGIVQWDEMYGGSGSELARAVVQTKDGGYALAGSTDSLGAGWEDFWVVKADSSGTLQWNETYGGAEFDYASSLVQTGEGGYAVAGTTESSGAGGYDFMLVKIPPTTAEDSSPPVTADDFNFVTHYRAFTITLTATDDLSGVAETYYTINDGVVRSVSADGQPRIAEERADNKLGYWSVDRVGNVETHHVLTGIVLDLSDHTLPVADAGNNQTVLQGMEVTLNASASTDNIAIESYSWSFSDGVARVLIGVAPSYRFNNTGSFAVTLNVTDLAGNSNIDMVWIHVLADTVSPVADAGVDQTVDDGVVMYFDGSGSSDNVGVVSYVWDFGDQSSGAGVTTTHTYAGPGDYQVTLTVNDVAGNSASDTLLVKVVGAGLPWPFSDLRILLLIVGVIIAVIFVAAALLLRRRKK
jgi:predicted secreted protein